MCACAEGCTGRVGLSRGGRAGWWWTAVSLSGPLYNITHRYSEGAAPHLWAIATQRPGCLDTTRRGARSVHNVIQTQPIVCLAHKPTPRAIFAGLL